MTGQRDPHTQVHDEKPAGMLGDRLRLMFDWYKGMVDESTGRLLYLYDPGNGVTIGDGELIRDIAAICDVQVLNGFLGRDDLRPLIRRSLDYFRRLIVERDEYAIVAPREKQSSNRKNSLYFPWITGNRPWRIVRWRLFPPPA
jgi:hypothetical protein